MPKEIIISFIVGIVLMCGALFFLSKPAPAADLLPRRAPVVCRAHSAITGNFVSRAYARANPNTTVVICRRRHAR